MKKAMRKQKVKLTKYVTVNLPTIPNFIVHEDGKTSDAVPLRLFSHRELRKIARVWSDELIKRGAP